MEDKRNNEVQRPGTRRNPKRHISLVSLLLWYKIAAVRCFVWCLGLRMWSGSEATRQLNLDLDEILKILKKFNIQLSEDVFLF